VLCKACITIFWRRTWRRFDVLMLYYFFECTTAKAGSLTGKDLCDYFDVMAIIRQNLGYVLIARYIMDSNNRKLVIATSNPGKYREIMEVLSGVPYEVKSSGELGLNDDCVEDGVTYRENALKKVQHYAAQTGFLTLAEDSGIVVDALEGELGVKTRRFGAGERASDEEWIEYFLDVLKDVPDTERTARFICCGALMDEEGEVRYFEGKTEGVITAGLEAPIYRGLPISSCFRPVGFEKVYAALSVAEKNRVSHRGKAMHAVREVLLGL